VAEWPEGWGVRSRMRDIQRIIGTVPWYVCRTWGPRV
jgi:hypothetical protein